MKPIYITLLILFSLSASASDFKKEQRWADQIIDFIIDGDAIWLTAGDHKILGIYTSSQTSHVKGAAIIVHGSGVHPNWEEVILPLRTALPETGWSTLSIQMPVLSNSADYSEYASVFDEIAPRINAAIKFLHQKDINNIVIIAHSLGSTMSAYYLSSNPNTKISGFIAIGMPGASKDTKMNNLQSLKKIKLPMLDLYGSNDLPSVLTSATERKRASVNNSHYSQAVVDEANHFFSGKNSELLTTVRQWLNRQ